jgi:hypothetical protein
MGPWQPLREQRFDEYRRDKREFSAVHIADQLVLQCVVRLERCFESAEFFVAGSGVERHELTFLI